MLSVLIPIYNWEVTDLVNGLYEQLSDSGVAFEIIVADDASDKSYHQQNQSIASRQGVTYIRYAENLGRSKLRNSLAKQAQYPYLLFMDCDAAIKTPSFIANYIALIRKEENAPFVALGGVAYRETPPPSSQKLRWYYGKQREEIPAHIRQQQPYKSFTPFNLLIARSIFDTITFDESLTTYGNEDTLFGFELKQHQIKIIHIDNPLYHEGLDANEVYLKKIETAIDNLVRITQQSTIDQAFIADNTLLTTYYRCKQKRIAPLIKFLYILMRPILKWGICKRYNLLLLDFYKLGYLIGVKG